MEQEIQRYRRLRWRVGAMQLMREKVVTNDSQWRRVLPKRVVDMFKRL